MTNINEKQLPQPSDDDCLHTSPPVRTASAGISALHCCSTDSTCFTNSTPWITMT